MFDLQTFYGPNAGYVLELYERYRQNPASVDAATRAIFDTMPAEIAQLIATPEVTTTGQNGHSKPASLFSPANSTNGAHLQSTEKPEVQPITEAPQISQVVAASALAHAIRERGHLGAHLDPLGTPPLGDPALLPETQGISEADLAALPAAVVRGHSAEGSRNALEAINKLRAMYSGTISYEFDQVKSPIERSWLRDAVGLNLYRQRLQPSESRKLLHRLTQVEAFERYLHQTFAGQKRFSIEGTDVLVPMLDSLISEAAETGTREVVIGMAHRGRLNVLAHVLQKPYAAILAEFSHAKHHDETPTSDSSDSGWSGDVKYHLGAEQILDKPGGTVGMKIILAPNPSHLEFVNPVVEGMARASQELWSRKTGAPGDVEVDHTLPILIHGDAAFPGEGIVAETMNLWRLHGYWVGGSVHIIVNNQIGFTTEPEAGRSTHFASDLAKGFEIPIIHVNADDPVAAITAVRMAKAFRDRFHKDVLVDLVGYRRWGHNEGDEPAFTQPQMYDLIRSHPTVREVYARQLEQEGVLKPSEAEAMLKEAFSVLEEARHEADSGKYQPQVENDTDSNHSGQAENPPAVSAPDLIKYNRELLEWPEDFSPNSKLARLLQKRATTLDTTGGIDWGQAEALAFASILADGTAIRLTGQDAERGTFSHRHAVLHDQHTGITYIPLVHLPQARAPFAVYNSPISEAAALGFEYGYSVRRKEALVLWEAQFGDFANVAQVIIDQFIASGRAKWRQKSGLVLLLPHGYEGQGPEHSSARLERYLQLSAGQNWRVANCSTAAQYFHLLRRQAFELHRDPLALIVMTPKSLLRHPLAAATLDQLSQDTFHPVLDDATALKQPHNIKRVVLCTGKISIDLLASPERAQSNEVAVVRLEMLYPFPACELTKVLANYPHARELVWVQEEPRNMGAWNYVAPQLSSITKNGQDQELKVISRPEQSSPATGFLDRYQAEQEQIIKNAFCLSNKQNGGTNGD